MSFRTIVIKNRCKLEYSLNYLVCRKVEEEQRILINEIGMLIIANTGVALTAALVSALIENKVKIIFCDTKSNPCGEVIGYYDNYSSYKKIKEQMSFSQNIKDSLWKRIIEKKIDNQRKNLLYIDLEEHEMLNDYMNNVTLGDKSNREGHAAKVYFNVIFGKNFTRDLDIETNKFLNYGYSIILSAINREIKICGYLTELGIHHIGETNPFNLGCDFMEPLRPLIDSFVMLDKVNNENFKDEFIRILDLEVIYNDNKMHLENAIKLYVQQLFKYLLSENTDTELKFIEYEL